MPPQVIVPHPLAPQPIPRWILPSYSDPVRADYALANGPGLTENERALLRRGASLRLVYQLQLTYSDDQGICAGIQINYSNLHMHFGWNFPSAWMPLSGEDIQDLIRWEVLCLPESYSIVNSCIYKLVRRH